MGSLGMNLFLQNPAPRPRIPEQVLQGWAAAGANKTAQATHESIRKVIASIPFAADMKPTIYLQGSYRNDTNIRGDSDVDIVIEFPFKKSLMLVRSNYEAEQWWGYRAAVVKALVQHYGAANVSVEKKCIKLKRTSWSLSADIVIAFPYCKTTQFPGIDQIYYTYGIRFYVVDEGRWVINYPKQHYENGTAKNSPQRTNGWYKHLVRIFKNAGGSINLDAPSYFVECLIYNAPDRLFGKSYQDSFDNILDYLATTQIGTFKCQNHVLQLFGNTQEQWSVNEAHDYIRELLRLRSCY